jgi:hypothetical protein
LGGRLRRGDGEGAIDTRCSKSLVADERGVWGCGSLGSDPIRQCCSKALQKQLEEPFVEADMVTCGKHEAVRVWWV